MRDYPPVVRTVEQHQSRAATYPPLPATCTAMPSAVGGDW